LLLTVVVIADFALASISGCTMTKATSGSAGAIERNGSETKNARIDRVSMSESTRQGIARKKAHRK
jgi:hypothetical protein